MHSPENFENPEKFNPERFLDENGRFETDVRVCPFSVGLRNCMGKQLAQERSKPTFNFIEILMYIFFRPKFQSLTQYFVFCPKFFVKIFHL